MANCTGCNTPNEYQDQPFICYSCRDGKPVVDSKPKSNQLPALPLHRDFKFQLGDVLIGNTALSYGEIVIMAYASCRIQGYKYIYIENEKITDLNFKDVSDDVKILAQIADAQDPKYNDRYNAWSLKCVEKYFRIK